MKNGLTLTNMSFIKSSYYNAIATGIGILTRLVVNKITALFIGPEGFAVYGQFKDFVALAISFCQLGTENGVIKYVSEQKENPEELKKIISTAFKVHLICALLLMSSVFLFKETLNRLLFENASYGNYIFISTVSVVFIALQNLFLSILNGLQILKKFVLITIFTTIITAVISVLGVYFYKLDGLILTIAINHIIVFLMTLWIILKSNHISISIFKERFSLNYFKKLLHFSAMSLSGMLSLSLSLLFIRTHIMNTSGIENAGLWDAAWRISAMYLLFLTSSFKFYMLPTFSAIDNSKLKAEIFKIWRITFPVILLITGGIYLLKDFWIPLLFSEEFITIGSILIFQLLGDIIKIHSWTLGNILMAKSQTKSFVAIQIAWAVLFSSLSYFLMNKYGLKGITMAYFFTCIVHFLLQNIAVKNILWFPKND